MTLTKYAAPLRNKPVAAVTTEDVLRVLNPLWQVKPETAGRLRGRIERVLDAAKARGWRSGENPARWRGHLSAALPARSVRTRGHMAAMPIDEVPALVQSLQERADLSARALEFLILTAARTGEVRGAKWIEFDVQRRLWTVPAERMKAGKAHQIPLSDRAVEIVEEMQKARRNDYVFPGAKADAALSDMAMLEYLRGMRGPGLTVHGFRSSFRDWAGDRTNYARDLAEAALAHSIKDKAEAAYRRATAVERRRQMMADWADFCSGRVTGDTI